LQAGLLGLNADELECQGLAIKKASIGSVDAAELLEALNLTQVGLATTFCMKMMKMARAARYTCSMSEKKQELNSKHDYAQATLKVHLCLVCAHHQIHAVLFWSMDAAVSYLQILAPMPFEQFA